MADAATTCVDEESSMPAKSCAKTGGGRIRLCVVVTVDVTLLNLCRGRLEHFIANGFDVTVVCAPTLRAEEIRSRGVRLETAPLTRRVSPLADLRAIWELYRLFRREKFDIIEVSTPKAALVGAIAARLSGAPCLVHLLRGLAYEQQSFMRRQWLKWAHWVPCRLAHRVISISQSTLEQGLADGLFRSDRGVVLGHGSSNGIDLERFRPATAVEREDARRQLAIPAEAVVVGFVGRLTNDKGVGELAEAFRRAAASRPNLRLLIVGDFERADRPAAEVEKFLRESDLVHTVGWREDIPRLLWAMDVFVLPTRREGFGTVLLEAAAAGLPVITTEAAGWWDAVQPESEAVRVPIGDAAALGRELARLADDADERRRLAAAGRAKVSAAYNCRTVWSMQEQEFRRLIGRSSGTHSLRHHSR